MVHDLGSDKVLLERQYAAVDGSWHAQQKRSTRPHHAVAVIASVVMAVVLWTWQRPSTSISFNDHVILDPYKSQPDTKMHWRSCKRNPDFQCGMMAVPKDYTNSSAGVSHVALVKFPATSKSRLGSLYINPGGPGGQGTLLAYAVGPTLSRVLNGTYDIVGFDPRGIGFSSPRVECFESAKAFAEFKANTLLERGFEVHPDPWSEKGRESLLRQHQALMALTEAKMAKCGEAMGDELRYMGTPTVVRDIEYMNHVLDGPEGRINFFGFSYGTILGAYLVNMLPSHKLGRVVIDGVASAIQWANEYTYEWLPDWLVSTEQAFDWFARDCVKAGSKICAVARDGEKPEQLQARLLKFLDNLYIDGPVAVPDAQRPGHLSSGLARTVLYLSTNIPALWPTISEAFAQAMNSRPTMLYEILAKPIPSSQEPNIQTDLSRIAVSCLDSPAFESRSQWPDASLMVDKTLAALEVSPHFAANVPVIEPDGGCQWWPVAGRAPETFNGPWNNTLETPMLIISNTVDPITPLTSGREIHRHMGNSSRLLIQNSVGHCSVSSVSRCTVKRWQRYFLFGELPKDEEVCEIDKGYFPVDENEQVVAAADGTEGLLQIASAWTDGWMKFELDYISG
ncbi:hypothetical protein OIO90_002101 [Microbotryomycetes sp. JL221]|nr:hypothetical protein OIO90_002101 [Microbotryomycetes sp. JL221]